MNSDVIEEEARRRGLFGLYVLRRLRNQKTKTLKPEALPSRFTNKDVQAYARIVRENRDRDTEDLLKRLGLIP